MAEHEVEVRAPIAEFEDDDPIEEGDLFQDVSDGGGGYTYVVAGLYGGLALITLDDGNYYVDPGPDPFNGDRADFRRIPGNRKITIE